MKLKLVLDDIIRATETLKFIWPNKWSEVINLNALFIKFNINDTWKVRRYFENKFSELQ